jgi:hypothetical protein
MNKENSRIAILFRFTGRWIVAGYVDDTFWFQVCEVF